MRTRVNLASQPFRNQRLPLIGAAVVAVALVAATAVQVLQVRDLVGRRSSELHAEVRRLEAERAELARVLSEVQEPEPGEERLERWALLAEVVDRRRFSWTALLARLEVVLPDDVRLVSVSPGSLGNGVELTLTAIARSPETALALVAALQRQGDFGAVIPISQVPREQGTEIRLNARYRPQAGGAAPEEAP